MKKTQIKIGKGINKSLPSNITEFLRDRTTQHAAAKKANKWLLSIVGRSFCGGVAIGKYYDTLVLDITYQSGEVYIDGNGVIKINNQIVYSKKEFVAMFNEMFDIVQE